LKILTCLVVAVVLLGAAPAMAQSPGTVAGIDEVTDGPTPEVILLPLNKARVFRLPREARDILVSNPAIADVVIKTPTMLYVLGREVGDTNVFVFDSEGKQITRLEIRVDLDLAALRQVLAEVMPDESIDVTAVNRDIVLSGTVRSAQAAENARLIARRFVQGDDNMVNLINVGSEQQVLLRVRVAEMQRTIVKQLGFRTTLGARNNNINAPGIASSSLIPQGTGPAFDRSFDAGFASAQRTIADPFGTAQLTVFAGAFNALSTAIDALESNGLVKTLAEPNLTAISGENANFLVGGEFPIPVPQDQNTITIEFKQFGILLTFTPVVLNSGVISLKISTEVSQLSTKAQVVLANFIIPSLSVNRAETTVELPSGGSLVIAGLLQDDIRNTIEGFPGLKDIPVLGSLFRSTSFQKDETELVVAVTPYLVRSVDDRSIVLPTDGFAPASDFDMYFLGRLHDVYAAPEDQPDVGRLQGPIGFIME